MNEYRVVHLEQRRLIGRYPTPEKMMLAVANMVQTHPAYRRRLAVFESTPDGQIVGKAVPVAQLDLLQWMG